MFNNNNIFDSKFKRKMSIRNKEKDAKAISRDFFYLSRIPGMLVIQWNNHPTKYKTSNQVEGKKMIT